MKIEKEIEKAKTKLKAQARDKGLCENFGQKEVSRLEQKFIHEADFSGAMNMNRTLIENFSEWCSTFEN